jgi:hypothetical protein
MASLKSASKYPPPFARIFIVARNDREFKMNKVKLYSRLWLGD